MPGAGKHHAPVGVIENHVSHADEHVLLDVRIKLAIHFLQNISGRRIARGLAAEDAATNRHDDRCRDALAGNIRYGHAELALVDFEVIEVVAADVARWNVDPADFKAWEDWRFAREQDSLDVPRDLEVMVEPLLLVRFGINDRVVKGE